MRKIIHGKLYDTETAETLISKSWATYHPNLSGGDPDCDHRRILFRTKKGALFGYAFDEIGYGRDRNGTTGAFRRNEETIESFATNAAALFWCEEENLDPEEVARILDVEEA